MSSVEAISDNGLRHLMEMVFKVVPNDNLYQLVRVKFNSIRHFMEGLKHVDNIKALKYYQSNAAITQEDVERLQSMYSFINNMQNMWGQPTAVGLLEYIKLTDYQYEGYMMEHDKNNIIEYDNDIAVKNTLNSPLRTLMKGPHVTNTTTTSNTSSTHTHVKTKSSNSKIKRSFDAFDIFDDVSKWKEWFKEFLKILNLMDVENAIDPAYTPSSDEEREKLKDDKTFVSTVLGKVMKEAAGAAVLKDHDDPTVAWPLIVETYTLGPKAAVQARKYQTFLSTAMIPEDIKDWDNVPLETQLDDFIEKLRLYNACSARPMHDDTFKSNFERFVMNVSDMRQVTTNINLDRVKTGKEPNLHTYLEYYKAQAISFDEVHGLTKTKLKTPSSSRMPTKNKNIASLTINELMAMSTGEDLSTEDIIYELFKTHMDPSVMLPKPIHKELTVEDKKLWAKMSPEGRKGIVKWGSSGGNEPSNGSGSVPGSTPNYPTTPSPSRPSQRRAYVTNQQPTILNEPEPVDTAPPSDTPVRSMNALTIMNAMRDPITREELSASGREDLIQHPSKEDSLSPGHPSRFLSDGTDLSYGDALTSKDGEEKASVRLGDEERKLRLNVLQQSQEKRMDDNPSSSALKKLLALGSRKSGKTEPTRYKMYKSVRPPDDDGDSPPDSKMDEADQVESGDNTEGDEGVAVDAVLSGDDGEQAQNENPHWSLPLLTPGILQQISITINGNVIEGFQSRMQPTDNPGLEQFHVGELCLIKNYVNHGPSEPTEITARFLGYAEDAGHGPAFIVLDPSTNKITYRSRIKKIKFDALQDQLSQHQRERYRPFQDENANNGMYGIVDGGSNQTQCGFSFQELGKSSWTDRYVETTSLSGVREEMRVGTQFAITVASNADGSNVREVKVVVHEGACAPGSPQYEGSVEVEGSIGGESVLSILQMQDQGLVVDTMPRSEGGYQCVYVPGRNIIIPLSIRDGITYMPLRPADDEDIIEIDEVITLTSGRRPWRPGYYDSEAEYDDVNDHANGGDGRANDDDNDNLEYQEDLSEMTGFASHVMHLTHQHFGPGSDYEISWGDSMVTPPLMSNGMLASWSHFVQVHEESYVQVNYEAEHHRMETVRAMENGVPKSAKEKLNLRIRLNAAVHDMIRALTIILDTPWITPSWATTLSHPNGRMESDYTILMHPHLITYLDIYNYTARDIIEGLMFGDESNFRRIYASDMADFTPIDYNFRRAYNEIRPGIRGPRDKIRELEDIVMKSPTAHQV